MSVITSDVVFSAVNAATVLIIIIGEVSGSAPSDDVLHIAVHENQSSRTSRIPYRVRRMFCPIELMVSV